METVDGKVRDQLEELGFMQASYSPFDRRLEFISNHNSEQTPQNSLFIRNIDYCEERLRAARFRNIVGHWI
jgi:hypothetical protein